MTRILLVLILTLSGCRNETSTPIINDDGVIHSGSDVIRFTSGISIPLSDGSVLTTITHPDPIKRWLTIYSKDEVIEIDCKDVGVPYDAEHPYPCNKFGKIKRRRIK